MNKPRTRSTVAAEELQTRSEPHSATIMSGDPAQEAFNLQLVHALKDKQVIAAFQDIFTMSQQKLTAQVAALTKSLDAVKVQLQAKDDQILSLTAENEKLQITVDNLEQYTRRASVRFYGIPESTPGSTDDKILTLCNTHLKFNPPLRREEIEVSHRIGKTEGKWDAVTKPRPIILKFVSRRDKSRTMQSRKKLRNLHPDTRRPRGRAGVDDDALTTPEGEDSNSDGDPTATPPEDFPNPVYVEDDLTQRRAKLAFNARCLRRDRIIDSTWVFDTRIMVKDAHGKIIEIKSQSELDKLDK